MSQFEYENRGHLSVMLVLFWESELNQIIKYIILRIVYFF